MTDRINLGSRDEVVRFICELQRNGYPWTARLFRGGLAAEFAFDPMTPEQSHARFKQFTRATARRPAIRLIGDDGGENLGPDGWPLARRAIEWSRTVMIHAAGAEMAHYEALIMAAKLCGRALIVETFSGALPNWIALVKALPPRAVLTIAPRSGVHPRPMQREELH
jgi:hypothetical protein